MSVSHVKDQGGPSDPRLELCGAHLLSKLLTTVRETLELPLASTHAWCDSTIVLAWLDGTPERYKTYVANRIVLINNLIPSSSWKHVPTEQNPADCASRGLAPSELKAHPLWWTGPDWLHQQPVKVPKQPNQQALSEFEAEESKPAVVAAIATAPATWLEHKYSSLRTLTHVTAWVIRFAHNFLACIRGHPPVRGDKLSVTDVESADLFLRKESQRRIFTAELNQLQSSPPKPISINNPLIALSPFLGATGLLRVGGRLSKASLTHEQKHPIIVSAKDIYVDLLLKYNHVMLSHCGPTLLLSNAGDLFHIVGGRRKVREVCRTCMTCRSVAAKLETQLIGQLPEPRVNAKLTFVHVGVDYAGPFTTKYGHVRKPVKLKAYLAVFVCLSSKAVHLEAVEDLSTPSFLATLKRFIARRGLPQHIYSDNGTNFLGAKNDLRELYLYLQSRMPFTPTSSTTESPGTTLQREHHTMEGCGRQL